MKAVESFIESLQRIHNSCRRLIQFCRALAGFDGVDQGFIKFEWELVESPPVLWSSSRGVRGTYWENGKENGSYYLGFRV